MMHKLALLILIVQFAAVERPPDHKEQLIFNRIEYISSLKSYIDEAVWKGFTDKKFDLPLIYYTDSACYVVNPTERFLAATRSKLVFEKKALKVYKTALLDSAPFHMVTNVTLGDSTAAYDYKSPFMSSSSFEITRNIVPDVDATEMWATMVMHEYFHGFQFKHPGFLSYFENNIALVPEDSLKNIYKSYRWFKESVDKENKMLLAALAASGNDEFYSSLDLFFQLREQRRQQTKQQLNFDSKPSESTYETMEGTARYAEYRLYQYFAQKSPDPLLLKNDSSYQAYQYFRNHTLEREPWLYLTDKTTYFYATGFNITRLLDKLKIDYKSRLFNEGALSLEQLLKEHWLEAGRK